MPIVRFVRPNEVDTPPEDTREVGGQLSALETRIALNVIVRAARRGDKRALGWLRRKGVVLNEQR